LPGPVGEALVLDGAEIAADAQVCGGTTVGRGVRVGPGAHVRGTLLFDGAVVGAGALVEHSVIGAGAVVEAGTVVVDAVVGDRAIVGAGCELRAGMRVWPGVVLPPHGVRFSHG